MTTVQQDRDFISDVINDELLEEVVSWIESNMDPEDVFSVSTLRQWAEDNGWVSGSRYTRCCLGSATQLHAN